MYVTNFAWNDMHVQGCMYAIFRNNIVCMHGVIKFNSVIVCYQLFFLQCSITVAASDRDDNFAIFSNHGNCVDIIAPVSAWHINLNIIS